MVYTVMSEILVSGVYLALRQSLAKNTIDATPSSLALLTLCLISLPLPVSRRWSQRMLLMATGDSRQSLTASLAPAPSPTSVTTFSGSAGVSNNVGMPDQRHSWQN